MARDAQSARYRVGTAVGPGGALVWRHRGAHRPPGVASMTRAVALVGGQRVQVEVVVWRALSVLARRVDNGALIVIPNELVT